MTEVTYTNPAFSLGDAREIAKDIFNREGEVRALPSERDQNFHLRTSAGDEFILKIANVTESREMLECQNCAMTHLADRLLTAMIPRICLTREGEEIATVSDADGAEHFVRLLTFHPVALFANVSPHSAALLRSFGRFLGSMDRELAEFSHPAAIRELKWDLKNSNWIRDYVRLIEDPSKRAIVEATLVDFDNRVVPAIPRLRSSVIHNDANDYNVLVGGDEWFNRKVVGIIDFGDMLLSSTVFELAIGIAYAILDKPDPLAAAAEIVGGYHSEYPLTKLELELLFLLVRTRLAVSVTNSALQRSIHPSNEYLTISERPAWEALSKLSGINDRLANCVFRDACALAPCPNGARVVEWLRNNPDAVGAVVDADLKNDDVVVFDLSVGSLDFGDLDELGDLDTFTTRLFERLDSDVAYPSGSDDSVDSRLISEDRPVKGTPRPTVGIGRYDEARLIYTSDLFKCAGNQGPAWRTIHLGIDLFMPAGSPVYAPIDGRVHSFRNNVGDGDYGPTLILEHQFGDVLFFTLYGHLSEDTLDGLQLGQQIKRSDRIASIGDAFVNGGWPPHLHFQIIADMLDRDGEFPGVALPGERDVWLSLSPDPNLILQIPLAAFPPAPLTAKEILSARDERLGPSLSVSYRRPLNIVRGWKQYLYDETGQRFLDAVNNVPHVGHSHPRVARAATRQMSVLNTNTRYLHENIVRYAERLTSTLPEPLEVCFFVCSGSEANELALRLARAHTGARDFIVVDGAYHGNTSSLVEISPYKFDGPGGTGAPPHVQKVPMPDVYRGGFKANDASAGAKYAIGVRNAIERIEAGGRRVAAFIAESILSCGGQIVLPGGYLAESYAHVRAAGGVCIADEVQVGFGRVGTNFWAFETQGVVPDIVTLGKPIGNGFPLGAVVTTRAIAQSFANGMEYFNTFGGNPVSCAVGLEVLDVIEDEGLQENALLVGRYFLNRLEELKSRHEIIGDVRGLGLFIGIEFVRNRETLEPAAREASYIAERMRDRGILVSTDGPLHNVLKIKPPMCFSKTNVDQFVTALDLILIEDWLKSEQNQG